MLFNTWVFGGFLILVLSIYWLLRTPNFQNPFLLIASLFFYGFGGVKFLALILLCSFSAYVAGRLIELHPQHSRKFLVTTALITLGTLFVFKYFNFFMDNFTTRLGWVGIELDSITVRLVLPIGISFFTFQSLGYVVDVHRGTVPAEKNPIVFFLFVTFFPQLVAGPIERANHLLPQIKKQRNLTGDDLLSGTFLLLQGLVKKIVIADNIKPIVDVLFAQEDLSSPLVVAALVGFTFQIYCDFSGYSDIARGVSRLLGFRLLLNFQRPYWSSSPSEFWNRWHITLSNWFRDYVYIALGGNRVSLGRNFINLFLTMTLSGLWHGASTNFILWGAYHGLLLIAYRVWKSNKNERTSQNYTKLLDVSSRLLTFAFMVYGWLLFRVTNWEQIKGYSVALVTDLSFASLGVLTLASMSIYVVGAIAVDICESQFVDKKTDNVKSTYLLAPYLTAMMLALLVLGSRSGGDFIYFKF